MRFFLFCLNFHFLLEVTEGDRDATDGDRARARKATPISPHHFTDAGCARAPIIDCAARFPVFKLLAHILRLSSAWLAARMPRKCSVFNCKSNYDSTTEKIPVFGFPNDPDERQRWLNVLRTASKKLHDISEFVTSRKKDPW